MVAAVYRSRLVAGLALLGVAFAVLTSGPTPAGAQPEPGTGPGSWDGTAALLRNGCPNRAPQRFAVSTVVPSRSFPTAVAVNPATGTLYSLQFSLPDRRMYLRVARETRPDVSVAWFVLPGSPAALAVDPWRNRVYLTDRVNNRVYVVSGVTRKIIATIAMGSEPSNLAVDVRWNRVYVSEYGDNRIAVISGASDTVVAHVQLGSSPGAIAIDPRTHAVYVINTQGSTGGSHPFDLWTGDSLSMIDADLHRVEVIPAGYFVYDLVIDPARRTIFVLLDNGTVVLISQDTRRVTSILPVGPTAGGNNPSGNHIALDQRRHLLYVVNDGSGAETVSVLQENSGFPVGTVAIGHYPQGVALDPRTQTAYVAFTGPEVGPRAPGIDVISSYPAFATPKPTTVTLTVVNDGSLSNETFVEFDTTVHPAPDGGLLRITDNGVNIYRDADVAIDPTTGFGSEVVAYYTPGRHVIRAYFSGDADYRPSQTETVFTLDSDRIIRP